MGYLTMNRKEREQLKIFATLKQGKIGQKEAAAQLQISTRWVRAKYKRYRKDGDTGLVHKNRGRPSLRRWNDKDREKALQLLRNEWQGFGPTFATEKLEELHSVTVSKETLRKEMIKEGLWHGKIRRSKYRRWRERRSMRGVMVQLDGSEHDWFEGRTQKCTLLVFIDDATSEILWLEFAKGESVEALMLATKNYITNHGIPQEFYVDHGAVFHVNLNNKEEEKKSQWERAMKQLGVNNIIHAHSSQAKGRVERCNSTMQDRLIKEMRLANICSIEEGNNFVHTSNFIKKHNEKYAVPAAHTGDAHRSIEGLNLNLILCLIDQRILTNDFTISFESKTLQIHEQQQTLLRPKDPITVRILLDGTIRLFVKKTELTFSKINKPQKTHKIKEFSSCSKPRTVHPNSRLWASGKLIPESRVKPALTVVESIV